MPTTPNGLPYPDPTGKLGAGADDIKALALALDPIVVPGITPIDRGGTGAATDVAARESLSVPHDGTSSQLKFTSPSFGQLSFEIPGQAYPTILASAASIPPPVNTSNFVQKTGDTMSGHLYLPNASAASSGYSVAYINGDGRVSRNASSRRFKRSITDAPDLADVFPPLREFAMIDGGDERHLGYIAEELAENPATERFVVWETDDEGKRTGETFGIDPIELLMAQVVALNARIAQLEARDG